MTTEIHLGDIDPAATLRIIAWPSNDPTCRWLDRGLVRAVLTPEGPGTIELRWTDPPVATATAWGDGAGWLLARADALLGCRDDIAGFDGSAHPSVARWWRQHGGLRLTATGVVWQELLFAILGQRVTSVDAAGAWTRLCHRWGEAAPGPHELRLAPTPERLGRLGYADFHPLDIERRRADALLTAARRATRLEEAASMAPAAAVERLCAFPGIGPWTATTVVSICHGHPDTVVLGDFWLPTVVTYNLTGDPTYHTDEARMLATLEPFAGQRGRVCRLLLQAGHLPPRRAPRRPPQRIARH